MISQQLMTLFNSMDSMICIKDFNNKYRFINETGLKIFNYNSILEINGLMDSDIISHAIEVHQSHTSDAYVNRFISEDERAYRNECMCILDVHCYNDAYYFLLTRKSPYYNCDNKQAGVIGQGIEMKKPSLTYIQQLLQNPFIETSEFSKLSIEKYFNITLSAYKLTNSERLCLQYVAHGKTAKEIAATLYKSVRTIESHLDNARNKLECSNRSELIAKAISEGLITYRKAKNNINK